MRDSGRGRISPVAGPRLRLLRDLDEATATEIERRVAWLRLALVPLLVLGDSLPHSGEGTAAFLGVLAAFAAYGLGVVVWVYRHRVGHGFALVVTAADIGAIVALAVLSGGALSPARLAFVAIPLMVAFRFRPAMAVLAAVATVVAYLVQALAHPSASDPGTTSEIALRVAYLAWVGAAAVLLSRVLERRTERVVDLAVSRQRLEARFRNLFEGVPIGLFQVDPDGRVIELNPAFLEMFRFPSLDAAVAADPFPAFVDPEDRARWRRLAEEDRLRGFEFQVRRYDGEAIWVRVTGRAVKSESGRTLYLEGSLDDVTERKQAEQELQARASQQAAVAELGQAALRERDVSALMEDAVALVARTLGVEYAKVLELLPGGEELLLRAGVGWREGLVRCELVSAARNSQAGYTLLSKQPVVSVDLRSEVRFTGPPLLTDHGVTSGMSVIIGSFEAPFGVLGAHTARRREFSPDDVNFLQAVANVLAGAIERAWADAALRESQEEYAASRQQLMLDALSAEERERQTLAEALHDHAIQSVLAARHDIQEAGGATRHPSLTRADAALGETLTGLREAIFELHPFVLDRAGLRAALGTAAQRAAQRGGFDVSLDLRSEGRHPHERLLFSAARQLLANVAQHAGAKHVTVRLADEDGSVLLTIEDDGCGFDPASLAARVAVGHIGLASQRERIESVGGTLEVQSAPAQGTKVSVRVPG